MKNVVFAVVLTMGAGGLPFEQASPHANVASQHSGTQECGSWSQPVLCQAVLRYGDDVLRADLDPASPLRMAPLASLDLEISGNDQFGRAFPQERLHLAFDARACASYLGAEHRSDGRVHISALATTGSCRLELWVPGNLNHAWSLEVVVAVPVRESYSSAEASLLVRSLYRGLLDREPHADGLRAAVAEVERGNLQEWVQSMTRSDEFRAARGAMDPPDVLEHLYRALFGRAVDNAGTQTYMPRIRAGQYAEAVLEMLRSPEFERRLAGER